MILEEFKAYAKTVTREEFLEKAVISTNCPTEYGLWCPRSEGKECNCYEGEKASECFKKALINIQFKDDMKAKDAVNHPSHYTHGKIETIDKIEDVLGLEGFQAYCVGNAIK